MTGFWQINLRLVLQLCTKQIKLLKSSVGNGPCLSVRGRNWTKSSDLPTYLFFCFLFELDKVFYYLKTVHEQLSSQKWKRLYSLPFYYKYLKVSKIKHTEYMFKFDCFFKNNFKWFLTVSVGTCRWTQVPTDGGGRGLLEIKLEAVVSCLSSELGTAEPFLQLSNWIFRKSQWKSSSKRLKSGLEVARVTPQVLRKWLGRTLSRITTLCQNCHILHSVTSVKEAKNSYLRLNCYSN